MSDAILGRCIGLIGGLGVGATVHYYQELVKAHAARGRVLNLVMAHADMNRALGAVQAGDLAGLAEYLSGLIGRLASAGADFAAIPAVTPHICIAELQKLSRLPIVNLVEELQREIAARGWRRVALLGTRVWDVTGRGCGGAGGGRDRIRSSNLHATGQRGRGLAGTAR